MKLTAPIALAALSCSALFTSVLSAAPSSVLGASGAKPSKPKSEKAKVTSVPAKMPAGIFRGKIVAARGFSYGYVHPQEGDSLELNLLDLNDLIKSREIVFSSNEKNRFRSYIPLTNRVSSVEIEPSYVEEKIKWRSLRAVFAGDVSKTHKVTVDIQRRLASEARMIILVESGNRIFGYYEMEGKVTDS